jgi:hypothetical protein
MAKERIEVDYLVQPAGGCIRWATHYCFSIPYKACLNHPVPGLTGPGGCVYSQYKPVWKRMQNRAKEADSMARDLQSQNLRTSRG